MGSFKVVGNSRTGLIERTKGRRGGKKANPVISSSHMDAALALEAVTKGVEFKSALTV